MQYKNRLYELRGNESQTEFAKKIGLTQQNYANYENGKQGLKSDLIEKVCRTFKCTAEWLLCLDDLPSDAPKGAFAPAPPRRAYLPLLGRVHAGDAQEPDVIDDQISLPYEIWERHQDAYFLEVEGDCMDKVYPEGCHILIDPDKEPQNGSVAVVSIDGTDYVMRRMLRTANTMVLSPESYNSEHEDVIITADSGHTVELIGTVVWFQPSKEME